MSQSASPEPATRRTPYLETFDDGPGGWLPWRPILAEGRGNVFVPPEVRGGVFHTRSPWHVDCQHAPPGAGYLHLLAYLHTARETDWARPNRFVRGGYSRDLTNARLTLRLRGEVDLRGAELVLLAQGDVPGTRTNHVLTGQPFRITPDWSEQTVTLAPDQAQWTCLGGRWDRPDYGYGDIATLLRDVNVDIILVLYPLEIVPTTPVEDIHRLRTHRDYEVDWRHLPEGEVQIDTVRLDYPESGAHAGPPAS